MKYICLLVFFAFLFMGCSGGVGTDVENVMNGVVDDGDGPVTQGEHLADAAGFESRGHEEGVCARVDFAGQNIAIEQVDGHPTGIPGGHFPQLGFIGAIAGPK